MIFTQELNDDLERLFKSKHASLKSSKGINAAKGGSSIALPFGGGKSQSARTKDNIRILNSIAYKESEVYIGVKGKQVSASHTAANFIYLSRIDRDEKQHVQLETSDGHILQSIDEMNQEAQNWHYHNQEGNNRRTGALSRSLVLSMPEKTDPQELLKAVKGFAEEEFNDRKYVMALHTDTEHPHVHLTIATRNQDLQRINITKGMLQDWREKLAEKLQDQDISANATSRTARGLYHNRSSKKHSQRDSQAHSNIKPAQLRMDETHTKSIYSRVIEQLETSKSYNDRMLAYSIEPLSKKHSGQFKSASGKIQHAMKALRDYPAEQDDEAFDKMLKRILGKEDFQQTMELRSNRTKAQSRTDKPKAKVKARKTKQKTRKTKTPKPPPRTRKQPPNREIEKILERARAQHKDRSR